MSRIGKKPVSITKGATITLDGNTVNVEGPKGKLTWEHRPEITVEVGEAEAVIKRTAEDRTSRELHGTTRAVIANMIEGVTSGYERRLQVVGVGYLANIAGDTLQLRVGYANELKQKIPADLKVECPSNTEIVVTGCDKQKVTQFAAEVRALRKPEPYKGKGIRYADEQVKIKPGKAAAK